MQVPVTNQHPPPAGVDEGLGQTGDEANEGCSAAPAFSSGETAGRMAQGKKVSGPQQGEPGYRTMEWAEHGVDVGTPFIV